MKLSYGNAEFLASCTALGLDHRVDRRGDWVFSIAGHPTWQVAGRRLGFDYSRFGIERWLAHDRALGRRKIGAEAAGRVREAIASAVEAGGAVPSVLGVIDGRRYTAKDVADMLDLCEDLGIRSMDDFLDASAGPMAADARERLRASWRLARSLGHLPEHRQRCDGTRLARKADIHGLDAPARRNASVQSATAPDCPHIEIEER